MTQPQSQLPDADEESFHAWTLVITIGLTKVATMVVVLVFAWGTESLLLIGATMLPWLLVTVALLSAPVAWYWRMKRMRRRRAALLQAEWMIDEPVAPRANVPGAMTSPASDHPR